MQQQLDIFGEAPQRPARAPAQIVTVRAYQRARRSDPSTSHDAAAEAEQLAASHKRRILACLRRYGPMGKDAIARRCRISGVAVARRTVELQRKGRIAPTGLTVQSDAGRPERQWKVLDASC